MRNTTNASACLKSLRWGHAEALSEFWVFSAFRLETGFTAALVQRHTVADRLWFWQEWTATPSSHSRRYVNPFVRGLRPPRWCNDSVPELPALSGRSGWFVIGGLALLPFVE